MSETFYPLMLNPLTGRVEVNYQGAGNPLKQDETLRIGNNAVLTRSPGVTGSARKSVLSAVGHRAQENEVITVALALSDVRFDAAAAPGTLYEANVYAELNFGVGGAPMSAVVDLKNGSQISLCAQTLDVVAFMDLTNLAGAPLSCKVSAAIVSGVAPARSFVTKSQPMAVVPANGALEIAVPLFAQSLMLFSPQASFFAGTNVTVEFTGSNAAAGYSGGAAISLLPASLWLTANTTDGLKLPNGANSVFILNGTGSDYDVKAMFGLAL